MDPDSYPADNSGRLANFLVNEVINDSKAAWTIR